MIKVLLVDDEKLALEYLEHIIDWEYHGFELIGVTTNPEQALAIYKTHRPDLVISDVKMPGLNGLELGDAIREYGGNTHILFLSAYKNFDYVKQAIRLGINLLFPVLSSLYSYELINNQPDYKDRSECLSS